VLGAAEELPLTVFGEQEYPEETRLRYRFLDLRREGLHRNMMLRSAVVADLRKRMWGQGFTEFQTPIITASSPEGARDFLVPSRLHPGKFYALPQAPQQFKQLIMVAGFDRYFQIAPCFRDEDPRADRSPTDFYQLDLEMSFVTQDDVFAAIQPVIQGAFEEFGNGRRVDRVWPRITYADAALWYGTDKPDLRNPIKMERGERAFPRLGLRRLREAPGAGGDRGPRDPGEGRRLARLLRPDERLGAEGGAAGDGLHLLAGRRRWRWCGIGAGGHARDTAGPCSGSLPRPPAPSPRTSAPSGPRRSGSNWGSGGRRGLLPRRQARDLRGGGGARADVIGEELGLIDEDRFAFCWIVDFPMYEKDDDGADRLLAQPLLHAAGRDRGASGRSAGGAGLPVRPRLQRLRAHSGAIRNHKLEIMYKAFEIAGYGRTRWRRFGGMVNAFRYGAPPHGGCALGIDRMVMLLADEANIREVIMFPMNQRAEDLMMGAPSEPTPQQLMELGLRVVPKE
jgi:aspartyl-tRNA synthetase